MRNLENGRSEECPSASAAADVGAAIAELTIRVAHLYSDRARTVHSTADIRAAARDKSRAESLYQWAVEAAETTNPAGHRVLRPELDELRKELDLLEISHAAGAR